MEFSRGEERSKIYEAGEVSQEELIFMKKDLSLEQKYDINELSQGGNIISVPYQYEKEDLKLLYKNPTDFMKEVERKDPYMENGFLYEQSKQKGLVALYEKDGFCQAIQLPNSLPIHKEKVKGDDIALNVAEVTGESGQNMDTPTFGKKIMALPKEFAEDKNLAKIFSKGIKNREISKKLKNTYYSNSIQVKGYTSETVFQTDAEGVNTPWRQLGGFSTGAALHTEDHDFASVNVMNILTEEMKEKLLKKNTEKNELLKNQGAKLWAAWGFEESKQLIKWLREKYPDLSCDAFWRHKVYWFNFMDKELPDRLKPNLFLQRPGHIIFTGPACLHIVLNIELSLNTSWNYSFYLEDENQKLEQILISLKAEVCSCSTPLQRLPVDTATISIYDENFEENCPLKCEIRGVPFKTKPRCMPKHLLDSHDRNRELLVKEGLYQETIVCFFCKKIELKKYSLMDHLQKSCSEKQKYIEFKERLYQFKKENGFLDERGPKKRRKTKEDMIETRKS